MVASMDSPPSPATASSSPMSWCKEKSIVLEINGGGKKKQKWYQHVQSELVER